MPETESSKQWYADESVWWNRHGEYMAFQWRLTPALNRVVRGALEREFSDYLFKECGTLLDLGCGSGWLAIHFAKRGMKVGGFDFSRELIDEAAASKAAEGLTDVHFECCDVVRRDFSDYEGKVDSVLINAFLHHLPEEDILAVFRNVGKVLKPGGRVYLWASSQSGAGMCSACPTRCRRCRSGRPSGRCSSAWSPYGTPSIAF